jgi:hypothetical protein
MNSLSQSARPRRSRKRWLVLALIALVAVAGGVYWQSSASDELSDQELTFVGTWRLAFAEDDAKVVVEADLLPNRSIRFRRLDRRTGAVLEQYPVFGTWRVQGNQFIETQMGPWSLAHWSGGFRTTNGTRSTITWESPDRFRRKWPGGNEVFNATWTRALCPTGP